MPPMVVDLDEATLSLFDDVGVATKVGIGHPTTQMAKAFIST